MYVSGKRYGHERGYTIAYRQHLADSHCKKCVTVPVMIPSPCIVGPKHSMICSLSSKGILHIDIAESRYGLHSLVPGII